VPGQRAGDGGAIELTRLVHPLTQPLHERPDARGIVEAAREAANLRFRAVVMTSLAFILGVVPLVTASGAGAASRVSLGVTVMAGMIAALVLVTLMTPMLYVIVQSMRERLGNQPTGPQAPESGLPAHNPVSQ